MNEVIALSLSFQQWEKSTDELVALANAITENPSKREMDMLLSTGEQVTISLLTMALQAKRAIMQFH